MANLKSRIKKLSSIRGSIKQRGINSLDLFLVGALTGLYSKKLFISNDDQSGARSSSGSGIVVKKNDEKTDPIEGEYSNTIKPFATAERLSSSVSDYVLKKALMYSRLRGCYFMDQCS